jgi:hypothetical protein
MEINILRSESKYYVDSAPNSFASGISKDARSTMALRAWYSEPIFSDINSAIVDVQQLEVKP